MKNSFCFLFISLFCSCDSLTHDFVSFLFDDPSAELTRTCSNNPSLLSDGRFIEVYELSDDTQKNLIERFPVNPVDSLDFPGTDDNPYFKRFKKSLSWRKTPVSDEDQIVFQVADDVGEEKLECFEVSDIDRLLKNEGNYCAFFYDVSGITLSTYRLYVVETRSRRMYLLTSYP